MKNKAKKAIACSTLASLLACCAAERRQREPQKRGELSGGAEPGAIVQYGLDRYSREEWVRADMVNHPLIMKEFGNKYEVQMIAFQSDRTGNNEIYVMRKDGKGVKKVTEYHAESIMPRWGGGRIMFMSNHGGKSATYRTDCEGKARYKVQEGQHSIFREVHSSLDGKVTAKAERMDREGKNSQENGVESGIVVIGREGGKRMMTGPGGMYGWPSVSHDGKRIACHGLHDGNWEIYVADIDGGSLMNVTNNSAAERWPSWTDDGNLVFASNRDGNWEIYLLNLEKNEAINLTRNPANDKFPAAAPYIRIRRRGGIF